MSGMIGSCKRYPPIFAGKDRESETAWLQPTTLDYDYCGEWSAKLNIKEGQ